MNALLIANLSTKTVLDGSGPWQPPTFTFGESLTIALRFRQVVAGNTIDPGLDIRGLSAAIGIVDARPLSETFAVQVGPGAQTADNTTDPLQHDCPASAMALAINAKAGIVAGYGTCVARKTINGSWILIFGSGVAEVPMRVVDNRLFPASFGRMTAAQVDAQWVHELRLIQLPVAFTDGSARILPPAPTITRVRAGGQSGDYTWNEIQALYVRPDFLATYSLELNYGRTDQLSVTDTTDTIQAALVSALGPNFTVTNPSPYTAHIEFTGLYSGTAMPLLTVLPLNPPAGDLTFTLALDKRELLVWLDAQPAVTLPLEVRILVMDPDAVERTYVVLTQAVTIQRPVTWPQLADVPAIDWLRPPSPKDYIPFSTDTVITGQQFFPAVIGDGAASEFAIAHGLATDAVFVWVRENISNGRQLIEGTDYTVRIVDAHGVLVTALTGAPALHAWLATVVSAQTVAAFAAGLHVTIGQVTGLDDRLTAVETRVGAIEALLPSVSPTAAASSGGDMSFALSERIEVYPGRFATGFSPKTAADKGTGLPHSAAGLLPAIHEATPASISGALPAASANTGLVFVVTVAPIVAPGGLGRRSVTVPLGGFIGSDGRVWYQMTHVSGTTSYFPTDFERELFMLPINDQMLIAGKKLTVEFDLTLALLKATTRGQILLVIETGEAPQDTTPVTTAPNLRDVTWDAAPLLSQRIILSEMQLTHHFGCSILRDKVGAITASKRLYGAWSGTATAPASANFTLRARLIQFDTEDSEPGARGFVYYDFANANAAIST